MPEIDEDDFVYDPDEFARDQEAVNRGIKKVLTPNFEVTFEDEKRK